MDLENGREYKAEAEGGDEGEQEALLQVPDEHPPVPKGRSSRCPVPPSSVLRFTASFLAGVCACLAWQYVFSGSLGSPTLPWKNSVNVAANGVHFPPASPTNAFPSYFPTDVGYPGPRETGDEAGLVATAPHYPMQTTAPQLVLPVSPKKSSSGFDISKHWGNLSPWYSVGNAFGLESGPEAPKGCRVTGLHLLHRHGARYPTGYSSYAGPAKLAQKLRKAQGLSASGKLSFLNDWNYVLGSDVLTHFGRQQLFDLGVSMRMKYGFLLQNFTETRTLPVFRTESQDRMLYSALNFAAGFFGLPFHEQYQQSIMIEADGFNNTLAPYKTCPNSNLPGKGMRSRPYMEEWTSIYLKDALPRLQKQVQGVSLTPEDVYTMQQLCAYETVALGYSAFCELFTEEEWIGFDYAMDLNFWYDYGFGSPATRTLGAGYVQEMLARLTHTPVTEHKFSTNSTLVDNPITFPLGQSLYVDATHEVVVLEVLVALNFSVLGDSPLPADHIPPNHNFVASRIVPFATNVQFQLLSCDAPVSGVSGEQIRVILNDGVVPLTGMRGCPNQRDGMCPLDKFIAGAQEIIDKVDWAWTCDGNWEIPAGNKWETTTGDPPLKA